MSNFTISIFGNKIFSEILNELKLFSKYRINFYEDLKQYEKNVAQDDQLIIFFISKSNEKDCKKLIKLNFPLIIVTNILEKKKIFSGEFIEQLVIPFSIFKLEKKIITLLSRYEFSKSSLIALNKYTIDKNQRKIKKGNLELQLTEKEIDFLILFSQNNRPITKNFVLKNVWNYSTESDTHTVETHIHRLRKKILEKFNDDDFIKNNDKGYYI